MATADEKVAEALASAAEGRIFRLRAEDDELAKASERRSEIADEIAVLEAEVAKFATRRPKRETPVLGATSRSQP